MLLPRLLQAKRWGKETLAGGGLDNRQFNDYVEGGTADAVLRGAGHGLDAARAQGRRRFGRARSARSTASIINIGTFSEEWLLHFNALVGGKRVSPIAIADARKNSAYFQATEAQTLDMARFFLKTTGAAPSRRTRRAATRYLSKDEQQLTRGKVAFAENCARCHSSKTVPPPVPGLDPAGCAGKDYLAVLEQLLGLDRDAEFKEKMREIVLAKDFLDDNYLSTEVRVPVTLLADQRVQSAGDQRDRRQHLGQLLVAVVQGSAVGRRDHLVSPVHRRAADLHDAGRRTRLHAARRRSSACGRPRPSC